MRVKEIKDSIDYFKKLLASKDYQELLFLYESTADPTTLSLMEHNIDAWFQSDHTQRLWKRRNYRPVEHLQLLIQQNEDYFYQALRDLLNEDKELSNRVERFIFYMNELLLLYRKDHPESTISNHQMDHSFISILLNRAYPHKYAFYRFSVFEKTALRIGAQPLPLVDDLVRFQKFINIYSTLMQKDSEFMSLHKNRMHRLGKTYNFFPVNVALECMLSREGVDIITD
jgi:hypothetical protein